MLPEPPNPVRVITLIAWISAKRRVNRMHGNLSAAFNKKKSNQPEQKRSGTARKGGRGSALMLAFLGFVFFFQAFVISSGFVSRLNSHFEERFDSGLAVSPDTYRSISVTVDALKIAQKWAPGSRERIDGEREQREFLKTLFKHEAMRGGVFSEEEETRRATEFQQVFDEKGLTGFRPRSSTPGNPFSVPEWVGTQQQQLMTQGLGLMFAFLFVTLCFLTLGQWSQDFGKVEWNMEWLFTFPISARVLFLAKIFEIMLSNPMVWFVFFPFSAVVFWSSGLGWWSIPAGLFIAAYFGVLLGSLHIFVETWLRKSFRVSALKNLQAFFTLTGTVGLFLMIWLSTQPTAIPYVERGIMSLPQELTWTPACVPILLCANPSEFLLPLLVMAGSVIVLPFCSISLSQWLVRNGLTTAGGAYEGSRAKPGVPLKEEPSRLSGIAGKEIRLLFRDRNFLAQTIVVPILIVGFQVLMNPAILKGAAGDLRHASAAAFGMGAYVLVFSAFQILVVEGNSLWMLYTFPRNLDSILLQKTRVWCGFGMIYTLCVLIGFGLASPKLQWTAISPAVTAVLGVIIYAYIASGIGVLATDPLQTEVQRKLRPDMMYLYMMLVAFYAYAIYSASVWAKFAQIILSSLLAFALWQKVRDRTPYMLDPTEEPASSISLADGMIAVLAFFVIQGLIMILLAIVKIGLPTGAQLLIAFVSAGAMVWFATMFSFWRHKVPNLLAAVGYRSMPGQRQSFARALAFGFLAGVCAGAFGIAYHRVADCVEALRVLKEEALKLNAGNDASLFWWFAGLAVFAAPVFEEYIFRGLVYRGLRRSVRPAIAIAASAGVFAIVHPPFSVIPVFGLGVAAAICFEKSQLIVAPIMAHMVYNFIVLIASRV